MIIAAALALTPSVVQASTRGAQGGEATTGRPGPRADQGTKEYCGGTPASSTFGHLVGKEACPRPHVEQQWTQLLLLNLDFYLVDATSFQKESD